MLILNTEQELPPLVLAYNNTSVAHELCPICGGEAGSFVGGSAVPLEIFRVNDLAHPICPECQREHAPELYEARRTYYGEESEECTT